MHVRSTIGFVQLASRSLPGRQVRRARHELACQTASPGAPGGVTPTLVLDDDTRHVLERVEHSPMPLVAEFSPALRVVSVRQSDRIETRQGWPPDVRHDQRARAAVRWSLMRSP